MIQLLMRGLISDAHKLLHASGVQCFAYVKVPFRVQSKSMGRANVAGCPGAHTPASQPLAVQRHHLDAGGMGHRIGRRRIGVEAQVAAQLRDVHIFVVVQNHVVWPVHTLPFSDVFPVRGKYLYAAVLAIRDIKRARTVDAHAVGNDELARA